MIRIALRSTRNTIKTNKRLSSINQSKRCFLQVPDIRSFSSSPNQVNENDNKNMTDSVFDDGLKDFFSNTNGSTDIDSIHSTVNQIGTTVLDKIHGDLSYSLPDLAVRSFDFIHQFTGMPWWVSIIITTFAARSLFLPLTVFSYRNNARMALARPYIQQLQDKAKNLTSIEERHAFGKEMRSLYKRFQIKPIQGIMIPFIQLPVYIGIFMGVERLGTYYPDFSTGGTLWFQDLTAADPYISLPIASALTLLISLEKTDVSAEGTMKRFKNIMRFCAVLAVPLTMKMQAGTLLYFTANNVFSLLQVGILSVPGVKPFLGIPIIPINKQKFMKTSLSAVDIALENTKKKDMIQTLVHKPKKKKL